MVGVKNMVRIVIPITTSNNMALNVVFLFFTDLITDLAKDRFGALQNEYQKVRFQNILYSVCELRIDFDPFL